MNDIQKNINDVFLQSFESTSKWLKVDEKFAFLEDPATGVVRTRTTAELCSSMIKFQKISKMDFDVDIKKIVNNLIQTFLDAGKISLDLRKKGLTKEIKSDNTPVSNGDLEVNKILTNRIFGN